MPAITGNMPSATIALPMSTPTEASVLTRSVETPVLSAGIPKAAEAQRPVLTQAHIHPGPDVSGQNTAIPAAN